MPLLNYIHFHNNHIKRNLWFKKSLKWDIFGVDIDIENIIKSCEICHSENAIKKIPDNPKIIITYCPNKHYQCDLWYLTENLK